MYKYKTIIFDLDDNLFKEDIDKPKANISREVFAELFNDGYNLCICSSGSGQYINNILEQFGFKKYFTIVKSIEGISKTHFIREILEETMSSSAIVVGDTVFDIKGAADTKCISIGISYGGDSELDSDFIVNSLMELPILINKINGFYHELGEYIISKKRVGLPLIVGINGVDASGKTQLSNELYKYLVRQGYSAEIVHLDDFYNPYAFNLEKLVSEVLYPIKEHGKLNTTIKSLDKASDQYINERSYIVNEETIVLVEGVLLCREPIDKYFDVRILLEVTFDAAIKRAIKREAWLKSDIVIDNLDYMNPKFLKLSTDNEVGNSIEIKLKPMGKKYLRDVIGMLEDHEAKEMLGVIYRPTLSNFKGKTTKSFAILAKSGVFLGIVELFNISWRNRRAEYSIVLQPMARHKGLGYLATHEILDIAFHELGLNRVWLRVLESNVKAIKLYERMGFVREGLCREESLRCGKSINQIQMSILKKEWITSNNKKLINS